jgi:hypothetical protein
MRIDWAPRHKSASGSSNSVCRPGDAHGIYQALRDWRTERKLIADERKILKAIKREAGVKGY